MKIKRIIFATKNEGKLKEIRQILGDEGIEVISMKEAGLDLAIVENGTTFEENARIKAEAVMAASGECAMADDSGLEIDAFDKAPGVYSARYLGEDTSYDIKNRIILDKMKDIPDQQRTARFVCAIALGIPGEKELLCTRAVMEGRIAREIEGKNGFGYDPIFFLPEKGCTSASLSPEEKNLISHRGKALREMADLIREMNR